MASFFLCTSTLSIMTCHHRAVATFAPLPDCTNSQRVLAKISRCNNLVECLDREAHRENNQKVKELFGKKPILIKNTTPPLSVLRLTISYVLHNIYHIQEFSSEDQGNVDSSKNKADTPKVDSLQKRMLAMSGQDVDAYMKEMEEVHRQTQAEKERELQSR